VMVSPVVTAAPLGAAPSALFIIGIEVWRRASAHVDPSRCRVDGRGHVHRTRLNIQGLRLHVDRRRFDVYGRTLDAH
jgi:hypothetical protein